jgi:catechol 2,3-dioxygenase-like lactoylglutathione lyase family enzyme
METRRIDHVTVATPDAKAADATFRRIFEFASAPATLGGSALRIGDARIEFVTPASGTPLAAVLASSGEGMVEVCLEVGSLDDAARALERAHVQHTTEQVGGGRRLRIDTSAAHGVRLTLIGRT